LLFKKSFLFRFLKKKRKGSASKQAARGFIRGGNWNNGVNSGAFTLNLNNAPANTNTNIGFRCARFSGLFDISRTEFCFLWKTKGIR